jgi:hypothetical protein
LSVKGTFGGILVAAEHFKRRSVNAHPIEKITLLHIGAALVLSATPKILEKSSTFAAAVCVLPRALVPISIEPNGANLALPTATFLFLY